MASMNNWLAFSLSPQEFQPSLQTQGEDVACSATDCYGFPIDSSSAPPPPPPLGIPNMRADSSSSFSILDAFNRTHHHQHHEHSMINGSSSELSMLVGSTSNRTTMDDEEPKLEDFLGGHSFADQKLPPYDGSSGYMFSNCSLQLPHSAAGMAAPSNGGSGGSSAIGISMIKTWLRNQPAALPENSTKNTSHEVCGASGALTAVPSNSQSLSLSMSTGSQSIPPLPLLTAGVNGGGDGSLTENKNKGSAAAVLDAQSGAIEAVPRKSIDTFGQRTSIYRGVTRHRWTGRYEAHLWDNSCRREGQTRKGRQVYLGGYDKEDKAARSYDLAALKYWGTTTTTNFPISNYEKELDEMKNMTRQEYVASLRRKSSGFSRGASIYRGVTRHHQHGRWQARIGRVAGNKDLYLGTFSTQEEAAEAYDIAAIKFRGLNAVTNFEMSRYDVNSILESSTLPIGGAAKRLKEASGHTEASVDGRRTDVDDTMTSQLTDCISYGSHHHLHHGWPTIAFQQAQPYYHYSSYGQPRGAWCKQEQDAAAAITAAHGLHDLQQLQLSGITHNFFQPASAMHGMMSLDSSSMEHSTGSSSVMYNNQGVMDGNGGYVMPISTMVVDQSHNNQGSNSYGGGDNETMLAETDPFTGRSVYYPAGVVKESGGGGYDQNSWMVSSVQDQMTPRSTTTITNNNIGGAPLFSVWNDA